MKRLLASDLRGPQQCEGAHLKNYTANKAHFHSLIYSPTFLISELRKIGDKGKKGTIIKHIK